MTRVDVFIYLQIPYYLLIHSLNYPFFIYLLQYTHSHTQLPLKMPGNRPLWKQLPILQSGYRRFHFMYPQTYPVPITPTQIVLPPYFTLFPVDSLQDLNNP